MVSLLPSIGKVVSQGYVVAATDYEGLGTPGTHPYLVGESEARGALDIVRAAQQIREAGAGDKTFVWGQSQGGQAALFAGEIQPTYAPELDLLGVISGAPVTDATAMFPAAATIPDTLGFAVMGLIGMQAAYPDAKVSDVLTPAGTQQGQDRRPEVLRRRARRVQAAGRPGDRAATRPRSRRSPTLFAADTPGRCPTIAPMLVYQGLSDDVVYKVFTDQYVQKACALGNTVDVQDVLRARTTTRRTTPPRRTSSSGCRPASPATRAVHLLSRALPRVRPRVPRHVDHASLGSQRVLSVDLLLNRPARRRRALRTASAALRATRSTPSRSSSPSWSPTPCSTPAPRSSSRWNRARHVRICVEDQSSDRPACAATTPTRSPAAASRWSSSWLVVGRRHDAVGQGRVVRGRRLRVRVTT